MDIFVREEQEDENMYGFVTDGEDPMFDDLYPAERWLDYLLDPGVGKENCSESFSEVSGHLNMVGLQLTEQILENYDAEDLDDVEDLERDIRGIEIFGHSEEIRAYAKHVRTTLHEEYPLE